MESFYGSPRGVKTLTGLRVVGGSLGTPNVKTGILLLNTGSADGNSSTNQQNSPAIVFVGAGYNQNNGLSQAVSARLYLAPLRGTPNAAANVILDFNTVGGFSPVGGAGITFGSFGVDLGLNGGSGSSFYAQGSGGLYWGSSASPETRILRSSDGVLKITDSTGSSFGRIQLGGTTSSFPAIGRNGIFLEVLAADGAATASLAVYNTKTSTTNFERLDVQWTTNVCQLWTEKGSGGGTARDLVLGADATELLRFQTGSKLGFFAIGTPVVQQTGGQNVTNNVTNASSTSGVIPDITDGVVYANDYTNLRNALFQIARMLKQDHDALRAYGLLT